MDTVEDHVATQEPQKDLMVNGLDIESKTYGRVEPRALTVEHRGSSASKHGDLPSGEQR